MPSTLVSLHARIGHQGSNMLPISFDLQTSGGHLMIGPNGCGKSLVAKVLSNLHSKDYALGWVVCGFGEHVRTVSEW